LPPSFWASEKPVESLNEHNEACGNVYHPRPSQQRQKYCCCLDCGTPVFSDPGQNLVRKAIDAGIKVVPIPGASSSYAGVGRSPGFSIDQFVFYGWLSPQTPAPHCGASAIESENGARCFDGHAVPGCSHFLRTSSDTFGSSRRLCVAFDLTLPDEEIFHGTGPLLLIN